MTWVFASITSWNLSSPIFITIDISQLAFRLHLLTCFWSVYVLVAGTCVRCSCRCRKLSEVGDQTQECLNHKQKEEVFLILG